MKPLLPKAIALWLIENTSLTFKQIADFCQLHILEIENLANRESHKSLHPTNPITTGETTLEEIKRCEEDPNATLSYYENQEYTKYVNTIKKQTKKQSRFKRKNKPEAILWIINQYPEINDYQITKLLNTTTNTIKAIRSKSYWNYKNLSPKNPVALELCTEADLSNLIQKTKDKKAKELDEQAKELNEQVNEA